MSRQSSYISIDNMSVGYNGRAIIRNICLDIRKGDIITLIGPNGAGKTTILKSITRHLPLIGGSVVFDGRNLHGISLRDLSKKMAVVLTERPKTELLTCYDIVASGRYPYTGKMGRLTEEDERKVDAAIAAVNATELGARDFNHISDGQRQRILLARAICQDPEIIILDEPTSFLDIRYKLELLSILRSMAKEKGITIIMSLHEIDLAQKISDRVICVKGDRIYRYGLPDEIFKEETIKELYELDNGFYDSVFGSIELPALKSAPEVFVISSCGKGIPVYRQLQKDNRSFATGILSTNDIDYQLARFLAAEVVSCSPFEQVSDEAFAKASELISMCRSVIVTDFPIGITNGKVGKLIELAETLGKVENSVR